MNFVTAAGDDAREEARKYLLQRWAPELVDDLTAWALRFGAQLRDARRGRGRRRPSDDDETERAVRDLLRRLPRHPEAARRPDLIEAIRLLHANMAITSDRAPYRGLEPPTRFAAEMFEHALLAEKVILNAPTIHRLAVLGGLEVRVGSNPAAKWKVYHRRARERVRVRLASDVEQLRATGDPACGAEASWLARALRALGSEGTPNRPRCPPR